MGEAAFKYWISYFQNVTWHFTTNEDKCGYRIDHMHRVMRRVKGWLTCSCWVLHIFEQTVWLSSIYVWERNGLCRIDLNYSICHWHGSRLQSNFRTYKIHTVCSKENGKENFVAGMLRHERNGQKIKHYYYRYGRFSASSGPLQYWFYHNTSEYWHNEDVTEPKFEHSLQ